MVPCNRVNAGGTCFHASESCGIFTGTEGKAWYNYNGHIISLHWNNPFVGGNSYSCSWPNCYIQGGNGNNAEVTFLIHNTSCVPSSSASPARSTIVSIENRSPHTLTWAGHHLSHGIWSPCASQRFSGDRSAPCSFIPPGSRCSYKSESNGVATGTEGWVRYKRGDEFIRIWWDNPYVGSNKYSCEGGRCSYSGGKGNNAHVTFQVG